MLFEFDLLEFRIRQADEEPDTGLECKADLRKRAPLQQLTPCNCGWIGHAPMRSYRLSRPSGAYFARRVVAHGKDKIEMGRTRRGELVPALTAGILER